MNTTHAETLPVATRAPGSPDWGVFVALWLRDGMRLRRERTRWLGLVAQPLMLWAVLGTGLAESFQMPGASGVTSLAFLFPGILAMVLLFTSIFSTMSIIEDRQSGFLQSVLVSPASSLALVLGKTAGVTTIVAAQAALFLLAAPLAGLAWSDIDWPLLALVLLLANAALTCGNFVAAWWLNSTQAYHAMMAVVLMPMWMVSGAMFPPPAGWMGRVVALNPMSYGVSALRHALGAPAGAHAPLATCVAVLTGMVLVALAAAVRITERR